VLAQAGRDPSGFVGALMRDDAGLPSTARWGSGPDFVVEADEYAGNFDPYRPAVALLLNAEWDHPDVFPDEDAVLDAFEAWIRGMEPWSGGEGDPMVLVANADDVGVGRLLARLADWPGRIVRYGLADDVPAGLGLAGRHNAANALGVAAVARELGLSEAKIAEGLTSFTGVGRRMELKGEIDGVVVLDDYGHHPTAIAATIAAARERYAGRRLWAVYEPLTYHRTAAMLDAFADVLVTADRVVIADIWAGRDPDTSIVSAADLAQAVNARDPGRASAPGSVETTADHLAEQVEPRDVVLVMGGGRSYVIAERLVERLEARAGRRDG
jgi:UDP-N-acetylmuramate--alanine ligase